MKKIYIVANKFYSADKKIINIGGIETYVIELSRALRGLYETVVVQLGDREEIICVNDISILTIPEKSCGKLVYWLEKKYLSGSDILLFSTEQWACRTAWEKVLVIQHGIYWDLPVKFYTTAALANIFPMVYKLYDTYRNYYKIKNFKNIVCVDYAYKNWYKSLFPVKNKKFKVILNFSSFEKNIAERDDAKKEIIEITFARRFVDIRGVDLAIECAEKLTEKYNNVKFNFIGSGPSAKKINEKFLNKSNIFIGVSSHDNMKNVILDSDIIFIPSLGSEGTSLIALEAMALGKVVVASDVGGLSNIIINKYNGYMCDPNVNEFMDIMSDLIENECLRREVGENALNMAEKVFSRNEWSTKWVNFLNEL